MKFSSNSPVHPEKRSETPKPFIFFYIAKWWWHENLTTPQSMHWNSMTETLQRPLTGRQCSGLKTMRWCQGLKTIHWCQILGHALGHAHRAAAINASHAWPYCGTSCEVLSPSSCLYGEVVCGCVLESICVCTFVWFRGF